MQKKRLIFVISSSIAGGGQIYLYNILSYLSESYSVLLICPDGYLPDKVEAEMAVDVVRMQVNVWHVGQLKKLFKEEIRKYGYIYVNANLLGTGLWVRMSLLRVNNVKFVVTLHNKVIYPEMASYKRFLYPIILRYVASSGCGFIAVSQEIADNVRVFSGKDCTYIPSSVPITEPPVMLSDNITQKDIIKIGYVGRLSQLKDPIRFVEMASIVKMKISQTQFVIIGDGELRTEVEKYISRNGIVDSVKMKGFISKPRHDMRELDVLVISSNSEGTPLVLLESMSYGVPVVSTRVGAIPLVIEDGIDGILCECSAESLAEGVIKLINNKELYRSVAKKAYDKIENKYNYKNNIQNYLRIMIGK